MAPAGVRSAASARLPPLQPWHACLLALFAGCLAWDAPWAGLPAWGLIFLLCRDLLRGPVRLVAAVACLGLGVGLAWLDMPRVQAPDWLSRRAEYQVTARMLERESLPGNRLRCILDHVTLTDSANTTRPLPGRLAWTWDYPPDSLLPALLPGAEIRTMLAVSPAGGFVNFGSQSSEGWWMRQGVVARAYSRGRDVAAEVLAPGWWPERLRAVLLHRTLDSLTRDDTDDPRFAAHQGRALALAMAFGERQWLSHETVDRLRTASLAHSIALSGAHVGFVASLGWAAAWGLGFLWPSAYLRLPRRKWGVVFGLALVAGYVWLGGATPSLLRAALMFAIWCLLTWRGRPAAVLDGLFLAVALLLLASPAMAVDLRLQLSVAAVAGIACYAGVLGWRLRGAAAGLAGVPGPHGSLRRMLGLLVQVLAVSVAAQAALLPLQLWHFGEVQSSFWCNAVWLPLLGLLVVPGALLGVLGTALAGLLPWMASVSGWLLDLSSVSADALLAGLGWLDARGMLQSHAAIRPHWAVWVGWWGIICWTTIRLAAGRSTPWQTAGLAGACALFVAGCLPTLLPASGQVRLTALDVGQGQALVLEGPDGSRALIDGGGFQSRTFDPGRSIILPALAWLRRPSLELVFISHHDVDHLRGCYYPISHLGPRRVLSNGGAPNADWDQARLAGALRQGGLKEEPLLAGEVLRLGDPAAGLRLAALNPRRKAAGAGNAESLTLCVLWQGRALAILPGDLERAGLEGLAARFGNRLAASALVLPHHGSGNSLSETFLDTVAPAVALASAGQWNQWGFPSDTVREALAARGVSLHVTAEAGAVRLEWDSPGSMPRVTTARGN
ncbi:DNA internalization-related competence protein ComEC/Rec2 [Megalodesulfovibrio gigas]|uniref:Putative DNA internalization-related competence protein ComEC/Rec2 n=2 Tax=Megalodesulfovibrio gigas TaxID=879 RepID=T2G890_MEGG1|nr:DNA internalization-related competence protein ComEC/Rec2 [Megalodesulfovibrio gigas]AGW12361.1 putative DNA internalization-related competence protein ComEC/Rec2 [Megalodesulfovibrio gigas DSM 1382 = ATCC 19364]